MDAWVWIVIAAVVVIAIVAIVAIVARQQRRRAELTGFVRPGVRARGRP